MYKQPHLQNFIMHTHYPILKCREHSFNTCLIITPQLLTLPDEGPEIYVVEARTEEGLSEDSAAFAHLSTRTLMPTLPHSDPGLDKSMHEPACSDMSFGVLSADETMSHMLQGATSTLLSLALSKSNTFYSGVSEQA